MVALSTLLCDHPISSASAKPSIFRFSPMRLEGQFGSARSVDGTSSSLIACFKTQTLEKS
jgi:hypothetical protein